MEVDARSKECPVCGYEFTGYSTGFKWVAVVLILIFLLYLLL